MATPTPEDLVLGFNNAAYQVRTRIEQYARAAWLGAGAWRDADIDRLVAQILPVVQGGQLQMANLTAAYVRAQAVLDGIPVAGVAVDRDEILGYRGVDTGEVYRRPAVTMRTELGKGAAFDAALNAGVARLGSIVSTDLQRAVTTQERRSYSGAGFEYTQRTLTGRENCGMCAIASTQRYHAADLRPIHPGCDCGSKRVKAGTDPGQVLDDGFLEQLHEMVVDQFGTTDRGARFLDGGNPVSDYLDLIVTHEHGEIGPILGWRGQHFTGPSDLH